MILLALWAFTLITVIITLLGRWMIKGWFTRQQAWDVLVTRGSPHPTARWGRMWIRGKATPEPVVAPSMTDDSAFRVRCGDCAELIRVEAIKCRFCGTAKPLVLTCDPPASMPKPLFPRLRLFRGGKAA